MQIWVLLMGAYLAPYSAQEWDGPWNAGMFVADKKATASEEECHRKAKWIVDNMHKGMRAPIRYKCIPFDKTLPKGAPR